MDARDAMKQAKNAAQTVTEKAKDQIRTTAEQPMEGISDRMESFSRAIQKTADELRNEGQPGMAAAVEKLVGGIDSFSKSLSQERPSDWFRRANELGRENPGVLFGTCLTVGFLLSRGAKGAAQGRDYDESKGPSGVSEPNVTESGANVTPLYGGTGGEIGSTVGGYGDSAGEPSGGENDTSGRRVI